jgi:hypothetical protein
LTLESIAVSLNSRYVLNANDPPSPQVTAGSLEGFMQSLLVVSALLLSLAAALGGAQAILTLLLHVMSKLR